MQITYNKETKRFIFEALLSKVRATTYDKGGLFVQLELDELECHELIMKLEDALSKELKEE